MVVSHTCTNLLTHSILNLFKVILSYMLSILHALFAKSIVIFSRGFLGANSNVPLLDTNLEGVHATKAFALIGKRMAIPSPC